MQSSKQPKVWVLLADGEHARVVTPTESEGQFHTVLTFDSESAHMQTSDLVTEGAGRVFESATSGRHAIAPKSDPHEQAKRKFAVEVAHHVNGHEQKYAFDQLVLVAPARVQHELRGALSGPSVAKMVGSLSKDLVKVTDHDLADHLSAWWLAPPG